MQLVGYLREPCYNRDCLTEQECFDHLPSQPHYHAVDEHGVIEREDFVWRVDEPQSATAAKQAQAVDIQDLPCR